MDREERPDVDRMYMLFVQASTGSGGWPMSVFLTPERKPFFGGTYFPPDNRYGRPGFGAVLQNLARAWQEDRARDRGIRRTGARAIGEVRGRCRGRKRGCAGKEALDTAFQAFRRMFDPRLGGFGGAPKFPRPSVHNFLVRYYAETGNEEALEMVLIDAARDGQGRHERSVGRRVSSLLGG